jgi:hypothetical protein
MTSENNLADPIPPPMTFERRRQIVPQCWRRSEGEQFFVIFLAARIGLTGGEQQKSGPTGRASAQMVKHLTVKNPSQTWFWANSSLDLVSTRHRTEK